MSILVWVMMGIAIWHFTVFLPDRFWGGIVGAFLAAIAGAVLIGLIVNGFAVPGRHDTHIGQALLADPRRADRAGRVLLLRRPPRGRVAGGTTGLRTLFRRIPRAGGDRSVRQSRRRMPSMAPPSRWSCTPYSVAAADELARELGVSAATAAILTRRGYDDPDAARHFLAADERHDPLDAAGRARGAARRSSATSPRARRSWCTATTTSTASAPRPSSCARCAASAPTRAGTSRAAPTATGSRSRRSSGSAASGAGLLVTVDCAITAVAEVAARARARARGRRHRPPPARPTSCPTARSCTRRSATTRSRSCAPRPSRTSWPRRCTGSPAATRTPLAGGPRPRRPRHGRRRRAPAGREPPARARGAGRARRARRSRGCAR